MDDRKQIVQLEARLVAAPALEAGSAMAELEMLADLYIQADHHMPALETIDRLLSLPEARTLSRARRTGLESKAVACRIERGDCQAALAQVRELLREETGLSSLALRARLHVLAARAAQNIGRIEESRLSAERGLQLADQAGDLPLSAKALSILGIAAYREGDLGLARD